MTNTTGLSWAVWVAGGIVLSVVLGGLFALAWHGTISGAIVVGIVTTIVSVVAAIFGVHMGSTAVTNGVTASSDALARRGV
jgi:hypothetical protein